MKIIDCFTFNGEMEILEIHLNVLKDFVDEFIIVEAPTTFSGRKKPLYFKEFLEGVKRGRYMVTPAILDKIKYHVIDENYSPEEIALAESSPNTKGAAHWKHEFLQKESIKKALTHLKDEDIVFIGDVDEIWNPKSKYMDRYDAMPNDVIKIGLKVYTYYLNNRSNEEFYGPICAHYKTIKNQCLNHLRSHGCDTHLVESGWHFTSMHYQLERKLKDSYTKESYATPEVMTNLNENVYNNRDFLGRNFTYRVDESEWPPWLKTHRGRYLQLLK